MKSALFENNVFLVAQHMMQYAVTGQAAAPMPSRISAWGIYDVFTVKDGEQIFLAVVSDTQWAVFCDVFGLADLKADARLATNNQRVQARGWLMPRLREHLSGLGATQIAQTFETHGLPYAPITRPQDLFDDPHLLATGALAPVEIAPGTCGCASPVMTRMPLLPLTLDGRRLPLRAAPPTLGEHTDALLAQLGYTAGEVAALHEAGIVGAATAAGGPDVSEPAAA